MARQIKRQRPIKKLKRPDANIKRRRKFTRQNRKLIYEAIHTGLPISKAIGLTGLDRSTYYRWMKKGKDYQYPVHMRFRNAVMRIQAKLEIEKLNIIRDVAQGKYKIKKTRVKSSQNGNIEIVRIVKTKAPDWKAAAWFLERRFPDEYGRKKQLNNAAIPEEKNPEKNVAQIKQALDVMFSSVPIGP